MRESRRDSYKQRKSTRDRFISVLRGEKEPESNLPWYRERRNYLPMLAIFMFILLLYVMRILHDNSYFEGLGEPKTIAPVAAPTQTPDDDAPMNYDEAKKILGG
ncbi:hypothetical protein K8I31_03490 [bacterium]|nr:hypothetical protein [bacterium]